MPPKLNLHLLPGYDRRYAPIPAARQRHWWEDNRKTSNHAKHCLPLSMANSLGYFILSPATFTVSWNGDVHANAVIKIHDACSHCEIDDHAAFGSFTVQAKFLPVTEKPGDFVYIKGIANERSCPFNCMEAAIEAWWSRARFGLVFLLNQPGEFLINLGQPIAQMFVYRGVAGAANLVLHDEYPDHYEEWNAKRSRPGYTKDFDYLNGRMPDLSQVPTHITQWRNANIYEES